MLFVAYRPFLPLTVSPIARALINTPKILFLDEPTTGLDPQTRKSIWNTITELQRKTGMTIFLTTHYMEEAAESDYVVALDHGEIVANGTPAELKTQYASDLLRLSVVEETTFRQVLQSLALTYTVREYYKAARHNGGYSHCGTVSKLHKQLSGVTGYDGRCLSWHYRKGASSMRTFMKRNLKLFFRDRSAVVFSLFAIFMMIALYAVFLRDVWLTDSMNDIEYANVLMNSWLVSGLLAVASITTNIGAFGVMVDDKVKK